MSGEHARRGTTLIELLVAITLVASVLALVRGIATQVEDTGAVLARSTTIHDRRYNATWQIKLLLARASSTSDSARMFRGDEHGADFISWCDTISGWLEECAVRLEVDVVGDSSLLVARAGSDAVAVSLGPGRAALRYLASPAVTAAWVEAWGPEQHPPFVVGVISGRGDSLAFRVGDRQ